MKVYRFAWLIGWLALYGMSIPCRAESPSGKPSGKAPHIQFEKTTYDFGKVQEGTEVTHIYKFRNVGADTLVLGKIRTSCGCTAALVSEREIPPNVGGEIKVTFDTTNRHGRNHKTITVPSNDPDNPKMQLTIAGEILIEIEIKPRFVNFGTIEKGETPSETVTVRFLSDPTQQVTKVESLTKGIEAKQVSSKRGQAEIQIQVAKDASQGRLSGRVQISTTSPNKPTDRIMVLANIQGEIGVHPSTLSGVFVKKKAGTVIRSIDLIKKGKKNLKIEKIEESTGRFTTRIAEVRKDEHYRIELSLREDAELGPFREMLRIHTNYRDQRIIEVPLSGRVKE